MIDDDSGSALVKFPGASVVLPDEIPSEVVARLEELLGRAKRGEIAGLAYVLINPAGGITFNWLGEADKAKFGFGISLLQHDFIRCQMSEVENAESGPGAPGAA